MSEITPALAPTAKASPLPARARTTQGVFLTLRLVPSVRLQCFYLWVYSLMVVLVWLAAAPVMTYPSVLLAVWVVNACLQVALVDRLRHCANMRGRLQLDRDGWWLARSGAVWEPVSLTGRARLLPGVVILPLRLGVKPCVDKPCVDKPYRRAYTLVLLADSVAAGSLRRLRLWLVTQAARL